MGRYSLIMKDKTYMKLMKMCIEQGITMGRLLNNIVDRAVEDVDSEIKIACHVCGIKPIMKVWKDNTVQLLCLEHYTEGVPHWDTWARIG